MRQTDKEGEEREERQTREERERGNTEKRRERERKENGLKGRERGVIILELLQSIIISLWRMEAGDSLRLVFPPPPLSLSHTHTHTQVQHFLCLSLSTLS